MSASYPDTNLPAQYRRPASTHRSSQTRHQNANPPPDDDDWPLAHVFASILEEELSLGQSGPYRSPVRQAPASSPPIIAGDMPTRTIVEKPIARESIVRIDRVRDENQDGVSIFFSAKYRKPFYIVFVILLMAATGNLSEIIQFFIRYL